MAMQVGPLPRRLRRDEHNGVSCILLSTAQVTHTRDWLPRTNSISDCFFCVCIVSSAGRCVIPNHLPYFHCLFANFVLFNGVDRLLDIAQNEITMTVVGLDHIVSVLQRYRWGSCKRVVVLSAPCHLAASQTRFRQGTNEQGQEAQRQMSRRHRRYLPWS